MIIMILDYKKAGKMLKEMLERKIQRSRETCECKDAYVKLCRETLELFDAVERSAFYMGESKLYNDDTAKECATKIVKACEQLCNLYETEIELQRVKGLDAINEKVKQEANGLEDNDLLLFGEELKDLLTEGVKLVQKR